MMSSVKIVKQIENYNVNYRNGVSISLRDNYLNLFSIFIYY